MILIFSIILAASSLLITVLVLMHKGSGGGLSAMFGGGISSSLGSSSVAERNLDRITVGVAIVWVVSIFVVALLLKASS
ncbi:MAG: preprotein translocase subunit SecG [Kineosporiaceae bacterium]|nr:preprotein translocase subunit SecG [Aeromicrobium sp.]